MRAAKERDRTRLGATRSDVYAESRRGQCARALALTTNGTTGSVEGVGSWGALELHGGM